MYDRTTRRTTDALALAARIRSGVAWQRTRALHRKTHPFCCDPFGDHGAVKGWNENSHHIAPLQTHPELAYDADNLAPLCTRCHARIEQMERVGEPTAHLFRTSAGSLPYPAEGEDARGPRNKP